MLDAVSVAIARVMRGNKNAKPMDKPMLEDYFDNLHLTEEEVVQREMEQLEAWLGVE